MTDANRLAEAYDMGFADAEDCWKAYGEKRWLDPVGWYWGTEEIFDSYWAGYEDYQPGIIVEENNIEQ